MSSRSRISLAILCVWLLGTPAARGAVGEPKDGGEQFTASLREATEGKRALNDVHIAGSHRDGINFAVYGRGVGFVKGTQVALTREPVLAILRKIEKAGFAAMPDHFGGFPAGVGGGPRPMRPVQLVGSLSVRIGTAQKSVTQLGGGEESKELLELVRGIEAELAASVEKGLKLEGLTLKAALAKLGAGELAPEAITLAVTASPRKAGGADGNWVMALEGGRLRLMATSIDIPWNDIEAMAKRLGTVLAEMDLDNFPKQLHHPTSLIGLHLTVQGMQNRLDISADVGPYNQQQKKAHPEAQKVFDSALAELTRIHEAAKAKQAGGAGGSR